MRQKQYFRILWGICGLLLCLSSCKDEVDLPEQNERDYDRIYMPQAANGPVRSTLKISNDLQVLTFGGNYGGTNSPSNDITVNFRVDNDVAESYNLTNNTSYELMPESSYTLSSTTAVIPKGKLQTPSLKVNVKTDGEGAINPFRTYILPISIVNTDMTVNEALRTTIFLVNTQPDLNDYPDYPRDDWQITGFSSQEASGEGPDNGRAIFVLDGNSNTFWHTQWAGGSPGPPHYITVDMNKEQVIHGFAFLGRQSDNSGKPQQVSVQVSNDGQNWTDAGNLTLQNTRNLQRQFLTEGFQSARYFKIIVNTAFGSSYTHLAELYAF